ncbi:PhzF family phenazine biosynthesis isomerase [Pedobacter sp. NJ-S-72]
MKENEDYQVIMTQGKFELSPAFDTTTTQQILAALGLGYDDTDERCPVQIASTGHSKVMIGIKSREKLNNLNPDYSSLITLSKQINCNGYFVFTFDSDDDDVLTYGRMFAPAIGINEDPVTGNANGPLGGYLIQNKIVDFKGNTFGFNGKQGEKINRPGVIGVSVEIENDLPVLIKIKGKAIAVFKTEIELEGLAR